MTRLDSAIRRLSAQRACLDLAMSLVRAVPGPVAELGLGNGRTYDHLRAGLPDREIFVFEREVRAHPDCVPDAAHLFLGDLRETLPSATARLGGSVALLHSDIGTGDARETAALVREIEPDLTRLLRPGAIVVSDQPLRAGSLVPLPLPEGVGSGRYFLYRAWNSAPIVQPRAD